MKRIILLNHNENTKLVEEEEKQRFLYFLLEQMGVPISEFWEEDSNLPLSVEQRIKLRGILSAYNIQIIDDGDGSMKVYVDKEKVGEWQKCTYKLKEDPGALQRNKKLFLEMNIDFWTAFDE
jgi:hypothetical protein